MKNTLSSGRPRDHHWSSLLPVLIIFVYIGVRLWRLGSYEPRADEVFSIFTARLGWSELLKAVAADMVHPPLFYLLLKVWMNIGGENLLWLRLFPVITSIVSLFPILFMARRLKLTARETNIALILLATNGFLIFYEQDIRMYSLLLLFSVCSILLFLRLLKEPPGRKLWLLYFLANILLVYTHYFGWFVIAVECLYGLVFARRLLRHLTLVFLGLVVSFSPWAYLTFASWRERSGLAGQLGWIDRPVFSDVIWFYVNLNGMLDIKRTTALGLLIFGGSIILWAWSTRKNFEDRATLWILACFSFLPVIIAFVVSQFLPQSVWGARYLIIVAVPYLLLLAVAGSRLPIRWARRIVPLLLVVWATVAGVQALHPSNSRITWSTLARAAVQEESGHEAVVNVYTNDYWIAHPLKFALEPFGKRFNVEVMKDVNKLKEHFWLAYRDSTWSERSPPQEMLASRGCLVGAPVVELRRNEKVVMMPVWCRP